MRSTPFLNNGLGRSSRGSNAGLTKFSKINSSVGMPSRKKKLIQMEKKRNKTKESLLQKKELLVYINKKIKQK
jgi:hypothetical protein